MRIALLVTAELSMRVINFALHGGVSFIAFAIDLDSLGTGGSTSCAIVAFLCSL